MLSNVLVFLRRLITPSSPTFTQPSRLSYLRYLSPIRLLTAPFFRFLHSLILRLTTLDAPESSSLFPLTRDRIAKSSINSQPSKLRTHRVL